MSETTTEPTTEPTIHLRSWAEAREAFRHRDLRQGLYDEGRDLMNDVIVNLHGTPHTSRRRLENRLFRRDVFFEWERVVIPRIVEEMLDPHLESGSADLIPVARKSMMSLATDIAGVDRPSGSDPEFESLYGQMTRLAQASNVGSATGDPQVVIASGADALAAFETQFFRPSYERRKAMLDAFERHEIAESDLPRDVLTTLLHNQDRLELPYGVVLRETAYYPWVGSHSTSNAFVHAMHHIFEWVRAHPDDLDRLRADPLLLQRFVHESLRLHPASPIAKRRSLADVVLSGGTVIPAGAVVIVDLVSANRDPEIFGPSSEAFDPFRAVPTDVTAWGLTFGTGFHACLGQELAGGLAAEPGSSLEAHLFGAITVMAAAVLRHGGRPDPSRPPERDPHTVRPNWGSYWVLFGA